MNLAREADSVKLNWRWWVVLPLQPCTRTAHAKTSFTWLVFAKSQSMKKRIEKFCVKCFALILEQQHIDNGIGPWMVSLSWAEFAVRSQIGNWTLAKVNSGMEWSLSLWPFLWAPTAYQARNASSCGIPQTPKRPYGKLWNPKKGPKSMKSAGFHSFTTGLPE